MKLGKWTLQAVCCALTLIGLAGNAWAVYLDGGRTLEFTG